MRYVPGFGDEVVVVMVSNEGQIFRVFDSQLVNPFQPCDAIGYGVFLDKGLKVRVSVKS